MPVRLRVAGVEVLTAPPHDLGGPDRVGIALSIRHLATFELATVRQVPRTGRAEVTLDEYGEWLLLKMEGTDVLLHPTRHEPGEGVTVRVLHATLLAAWEAFAARVHRLVVARHPEEAEWSAWRYLAEDPEWSPLVAVREDVFTEHEHCFDRVDAIEEVNTR